MISRELFLKLFPQASASTLRMNTDSDVNQSVAAQKTTAQSESLPKTPAPMLASCDVPVGIICNVRQSVDEESLNKTERRYLMHLRSQRYEWIGVQNVTIKLSHDTRFTPDFCTVGDNRFTMHDVKAFWKSKGKPHIEDDARAKIYCAARMFPFFYFVIAWEEKGLWITREIKP